MIIGMAINVIASIVFACAFTFMDARDKRVNTGFLATFFLLGSVITAINAIDSHTLEYLGTYILSLVVILVGGILEKRGWFGEGDFDFFGIMLLFYPPWIAVNHLPFVWWMLMGTFLSLIAGSLVTIVTDRLTGIKQEKKEFSLGPFLMAGLLWAILAAAVG